MLKRTFEEMEAAINDRQPVQNSLDSDEEDEETNEDTYNVMDENEFEGIKLLSLRFISKFVKSFKKSKKR